MLDDLITRVRAKVDSDYRAVVIATANSDQVKVDRIVDSLTHIGRSLDQFAADVQRVMTRRELAARLPEIDTLDQAIATAEQDVKETRHAEEKAKGKLDRVSTDKVNMSSVDLELAINAAKHLVADASVKQRAAFETKTALFKQREKLLQSIVIPLEATGQSGADATDPDAFALT